MKSRRGAFAGSVILAAVFMVCGCTSIYRTGLMPGQTGSVATVTEDAKQRNVFMAQEQGIVENGAPGIRLCAEASPDALSAISSSFSGELHDALGSTNPELSAKAALAISEVAASIPRTQTINALRESMYRTCERYLNNAISKDEFIIQAAREQRILVSILAIEQLTQPSRPPVIMLNAGSPTAGAGDAPDYLKAVSDASDAVVDANTDNKTKQAAYDKAGDPKKCDDLLKTADAAKVPEADKTAWKACDDAAKNLAKSNDAVAKAKAKLASLQTVAAAASGTSTSVGPGSIAVQPASPDSAANTAAVAQVIKHIVDKAFEFDELQETCIVALRNNSAENPLYKACVPLVTAELHKQAMTLGLTEQEIKLLQQQSASNTATLKHFLELSPDIKSRWAALLAKADLKDHDLPSWQALTKEEDMLKAFEKMVDASRARIMAAIGAMQ